MDFQVEHGHQDEAGRWVSDYPPMAFTSGSLQEAKSYVEAKIKEGAFPAWKGGFQLRVWSASEEAICSFKEDFSADWT